MTEKTLLLVDDEADIREVLALALADLGYRVLTAANGAEALALFSAHHPPVVLTDIKMPGMDGIELLRKIKQNNPETEVLMITGHGDLDLAVRSFQEAAGDFITKPIDLDVLEIALRRIEEKITLRRQLTEYTTSLEAVLQQKTAELTSVRQRLNAVPAPGEPPGESRPDLQELLDRLPCFLSVQDRAFQITACNRRFAEEFAHGPGSACYHVCRQRNDPCPACPAVKTFADGKSYQAELSLTGTAGNEIRVLAWTSPVRGADGEITHVMVMSTVVSQIRELQDHLSSLGLMIGSVSHGIKGLLTGLDGGMYLLDAGLAKENREQIQEGLQVVKQTGDRIKRMVLDILFYAKERELKRESVDVLGFAEELARGVQARARALGVELIRDFHPSPGAFEIDPGFVHTALVNLLENALDACAADSGAKAPRVVFGALPERDQIRFTVADNGIGMDPETQARMFDLFFSNKGQTGTGLGLFITRKVIEQHGGTLRVDSAPGTGTTMEVLLPRRVLPREA